MDFEDDGMREEGQEEEKVRDRPDLAAWHGVLAGSRGAAGGSDVVEKAKTVAGASGSCCAQDGDWELLEARNRGPEGGGWWTTARRSCSLLSFELCVCLLLW